MSGIVYKEGDKVYCLNDHFVASIKRDVLSAEVCSTELFDFADNQQFKAGDELRCKICNERFTLTNSPWVTLNIKNENR